MRGYVKPEMKFGNKTYYFMHGHRTKEAANREAKVLRERGLGVRIIKRATGEIKYWIYTTKK